MKLYLDIKKEGRLVKIYQVTDIITIIGSSKGHLILPDKKISPSHLCIKLEGVKVIIEDLDSRNGTVVGDRKIYDRHILKKDETILIGSYTLSLRLAKDKDELKSFINYEGDKITNYETTFRPHSFSLKALENK